MIPTAIFDVIQRYFDALYRADAKLLEEVMHNQAIYASADETPMLFRTMDEYLPIVAAREAPESRGEARNDVIEMVSLAGDNTALARVRCSIGNRNFTDFLTLVRDQGEWRILAKIFQISNREQ